MDKPGEAGDRERLLDRFREVVLAGGLVCPTVSDVVRSEANNLRPYGPLVDPKLDAEIRMTFQRNARPHDADSIERRRRRDEAFIEHMKRDVETLTQVYGSTHPDDVEAESSFLCPEQRMTRLTAWNNSIDSCSIHEAANKLLGQMIDHPQEYYLSDEWVSWHLARVWLVWLNECAFLRQYGCRLNKNKRLSLDEALEHDLQDMKTIVFLSRVDGLLMYDTFWRDVAHTVFPYKDVFEKIEDVPESYRCDWTG